MYVNKSLFVLKILTSTAPKNYNELFARTGEPLVPSLQSLGLLSVQGTTLRGFFDLNVRRAKAAKSYLQLFRDNRIDAILMPPAPHTAIPLDTWNNATYTGLWNYLDYPAIVFPVDKVQESDLADDPSEAKYGPDDSRLYDLCMHEYFSTPSYLAKVLVADVIQLFRHGTRALQKRANLRSAGWISTYGRSFSKHSNGA